MAGRPQASRIASVSLWLGEPEDAVVAELPHGHFLAHGWDREQQVEGLLALAPEEAPPHVDVASSRV